MGAAFLCRTYPDMTEAELAKCVADDCASDAHEDGRSYSGSWGVKNGYDIERTGYGRSSPVKTFETVREAEEYIEENNDKWAPLTAVRAKTVEVPLPNGKFASSDGYGPSQIPYSKKVLELNEKAKEAQVAWHAYGPSILKRVKASKSKTKGCSKCGSALATSYIQSLQCPMCRHEYLMTDTDIKKLTALKQKYEKLQKAADTARDVELKKFGEKYSKMVWVVGGMCSS